MYSHMALVVSSGALAGTQDPCYVVDTTVNRRIDELVRCRAAPSDSPLQQTRMHAVQLLTYKAGKNY